MREGIDFDEVTLRHPVRSIFTEYCSAFASTIVVDHRLRSYRERERERERERAGEN